MKKKVKRCTYNNALLSNISALCTFPLFSLRALKTASLLVSLSLLSLFFTPQHLISRGEPPRSKKFVQHSKLKETHRSLVTVGFYRYLHLPGTFGSTKNSEISNASTLIQFCGVSHTPSEISRNVIFRSQKVRQSWSV